MLGIDIIEIKQVKSIYKKHGLVFIKKILNDKEIKDLPLKENDYFFKKISCYIASKEAIFKASSQDKLRWKDISIENITRNPIAHIAQSGFKDKIELSVSASDGIVLAQALII